MMKTIIIGDVHGCYDELINLLEKVEFNKDVDKLISLGDLMDRGNQSYEVFDYFRKLKAEAGERCVIIRGNHEQMMMDAAVHLIDREWWKQNGGGKTIQSFFKHKSHVYLHAGWFKKNTVLYDKEELFQCAHAGLDRENIAENSQEILLWDRNRVSRNDYYGKLTVVGHTPILYATWYAGDKKTKEILPERKRMLLPEAGLLCLDTGCVFGRRLTAMVVEGKEYWLDSVFRGRGDEEQEIGRTWHLM